MAEKNIKDLLKPIYASVEKLVPTNRMLINFVNEKALGQGMKRSIYKIKFIDKAEKSSFQLANVTLSEFQKHLKEIKLGEEESKILMDEAEEILGEARKQIEKVYGDVRRYVVTSEIRTACLKQYYRKIPSLNEEQNEAISKEIFSLALEFVNKSDKHTLDDIEDEFQKVNHIAITLFNLAAATGDTTSKTKKITHKNKTSTGFFDRFLS